MNTPTTAQVQLGMAIAGAAAPVLGPQAVLLVGVAGSIMQVVMESMQTGQDTTPEQYQALIKQLLEADAQQRAISMAANARAVAEGR